MTTKFLDNICDEDQHFLLEQGELLYLRAKETLIQEHAKDREFYVIITGHVNVTAADGRVIATLSEGDLLGEMALFLEPSSRTATITALEESTLLKLAPSVIQNLKSDHPMLAIGLLWNLSAILAQRLANTTKA